MKVTPLLHYATAFGCALLVTACSGGDSKKVPAIPVSGALNDTGLLQCSGQEETQLECPQQALPKQDAEFGRDAQAAGGLLQKTGAGVGGFDWSKIDSNGNLLAVQNAPWDDMGNEHSGTRWSCALDHVTELMWEVKESDSEHPRHGEHTYSWRDEREAFNGGEPGAADGGACATAPCDTQGFVGWVNASGLCGHEDWRMPTVAELASLAVLSKVIPAVDADFFPNTTKPRFFTAHTNAKDPSLAWYVYFSDGSVSSTNKADPSQVRLVRGGQQ